MNKELFNFQITGTHILKLALLLFGFLLILFTYKEFIFRVQFLKNVKKTEAQIISVEQKQLYTARQGQRVASNPEEYGWASVGVVYADSNNQTIITQTSSLIHNFFPGIKVINIYYHDDNPKIVLASNFFIYWFNTFAYLLVALFFIIIAFSKSDGWMKGQNKLS